MVHLIHRKRVPLLHNTVLILCDEGDGLVAVYIYLGAAQKVILLGCHVTRYDILRRGRSRSHPGVKVTKMKEPEIRNIGLDKQNFSALNCIFFLFINFNIFFGCSKEPSH